MANFLTLHFAASNNKNTGAYYTNLKELRPDVLFIKEWIAWFKNQSSGGITYTDLPQSDRYTGLKRSWDVVMQDGTSIPCQTNWNHWQEVDHLDQYFDTLPEPLKWLYSNYWVFSDVPVEPTGSSEINYIGLNPEGRVICIRKGLGLTTFEGAGYVRGLNIKATLGSGSVLDLFLAHARVDDATVVRLGDESYPMLTDAAMLEMTPWFKAVAVSCAESITSGSMRGTMFALDANSCQLWYQKAGFDNLVFTYPPPSEATTNSADGPQQGIWQGTNIDFFGCSRNLSFYSGERTYTGVDDHQSLTIRATGNLTLGPNELRTPSKETGILALPRQQILNAVVSASGNSFQLLVDELTTINANVPAKTGLGPG